jgi:UTP--glucose-1-phosphate uridylyltransferase
MKLIIPAAGHGSRLWPLTKVIAKEFLPIGKNPAIDFIIADAYNAGITEIVIVICQQKTYVTKYFTDLPDLPSFAFLKKALSKLKISFVYQEPTGLGDAIAAALDFCHFELDELVAIALPDEILVNDNGMPCGLKDLIYLNKESILVQKTAHELLNLYGIISFTGLVIKQIEEKPCIENAPSNFAVIGRYLLNAKNLQMSLNKYAKMGDLNFSFALNNIIQDHEILLQEFSKKRFDTGSFSGYFKANNFFQNLDYLLI